MEASNALLPPLPPPKGTTFLGAPFPGFFDWIWANRLAGGGGRGMVRLLLIASGRTLSAGAFVGAADYNHNTERYRTPLVL